MSFSEPKRVRARNVHDPEPEPSPMRWLSLPLVLFIRLVVCEHEVAAYVLPRLAASAAYAWASAHSLAWIHGDGYLPVGVAALLHLEVPHHGSRVLLVLAASANLFWRRELSEAQRVCVRRLPAALAESTWVRALLAAVRAKSIQVAASPPYAAWRSWCAGGAGSARRYADARDPGGASHRWRRRWWWWWWCCCDRLVAPVARTLFSSCVRPVARQLGALLERSRTHVSSRLRRTGRRGLTVRDFTLAVGQLHLEPTNVVVTDPTLHAASAVGRWTRSTEAPTVWLHNDAMAAAHCHLFVNGRPHDEIIRVPPFACVAVAPPAPLVPHGDACEVAASAGFAVAARFVLVHAHAPLRSRASVEALVPEWYAACWALEGNIGNADEVRDSETLCELHEHPLTSVFLQVKSTH